MTMTTSLCFAALYFPVVLTWNLYRHAPSQPAPGFLDRPFLPFTSGFQDFNFFRARGLEQQPGVTSRKRHVGQDSSRQFQQLVRPVAGPPTQQLVISRAGLPTFNSIATPEPEKLGTIARVDDIELIGIEEPVAELIDDGFEPAVMLPEVEFPVFAAVPGKEDFPPAISGPEEFPTASSGPRDLPPAVSGPRSQSLKEPRKVHPEKFLNFTFLPAVPRRTDLDDQEAPDRPAINDQDIPITPALNPQAVPDRSALNPQAVPDRQLDIFSGSLPLSSDPIIIDSDIFGSMPSPKGGRGQFEFPADIRPAGEKATPDNNEVEEEIPVELVKNRKSTRKEFRRCQGKCVQRGCLPIDDLDVYASCVETCRQTCL